MVKYRNRPKPNKKHPWKAGLKGFDHRDKKEKDFSGYVQENFKSIKKKNSRGKYISRQKHEKGTP